MYIMKVKYMKNHTYELRMKYLTEERWLQLQMQLK